MGYVYAPTTMTVLKWLGIVVLYAVIIAIIAAAFRYFAHEIDLDYLFNIDGMCDGLSQWLPAKFPHLIKKKASKEKGLFCFERKYKFFVEKVE